MCYMFPGDPARRDELLFLNRKRVGARAYPWQRVIVGVERSGSRAKGSSASMTSQGSGAWMMSLGLGETDEVEEH
jgi:hypothetical protein